jgi:hypothetical protein
VGRKACFTDSLLQQKHGIALAPKTVQQDNLLLRIWFIGKQTAPDYY